MYSRLRDMRFNFSLLQLATKGFQMSIAFICTQVMNSYIWFSV